MNMSSKHTKNYLEKLHPNISVMRHPDHIGAKGEPILFMMTSCYSYFHDPR